MLKLLTMLAALLVGATAHAQPPPRDQNELRELIISAKYAPGFSQKYGSRDVGRTMIAAGVEMMPFEVFYMAQGLMVSQPVEAEALMAPYFERGELGGKAGSGPHERHIWERVQRQAEVDRQHGLARTMEQLNQAEAFVDSAIPVAESLLVMGDHRTAIDLLRRALATEKLDEDAAATARLSLCRALLAAGRVSETKWELENFPPAPGYDVLTRVWLAVAIEQEAATSNPSSPALP